MTKIRLLSSVMLLIAALLMDKALAADTFLDTLLRFTGVSATPSQVRGNGESVEGDIWVARIDNAGNSEPDRLTRGGDYRSPLWIPGNQMILAIKGDSLVKLSAQGGGEKTSFALKGTAKLISFDKNDQNQVLVLQDENGKPMAGVLLLTSGRVTRLPYDSNNSEHRLRINQLMGNFRDYGNAQVDVETKKTLDPRGRFQISSNIHVKLNQEDILLPCPAACSQPALSDDSRKVVFISK